MLVNLKLRWDGLHWYYCCTLLHWYYYFFLGYHSTALITLIATILLVLGSCQLHFTASFEKHAFAQFKQKTTLLYWKALKAITKLLMTKNNNLITMLS